MGDTITAAYLARYAESAAGDPSAHPVTGAQRRFLTVRRLSGGARPILVPLYFDFPRGTVDPARLEQAAACLAARHPALRMRFDVAGPVPVQRLGEPRGLVRRVAAVPGEGAAAALRRELLTWPADGPVLRLLLATSGERPDVETLALVVDHAACDEPSLGALTEGLTRAYRDRTTAREALAETGQESVAQYRDAVERQLAAERAASAPRSLAHWTGRLGGVVPTGLSTGASPAVSTGGDDDPTGMLRYRRPTAPGTARAALFPALLAATAEAVACASPAVPGRPAPKGPPAAPPALRPTPLVGYPWGGRPLGAAPVMGCFLNTVLFAAGTPGDLDDASDRWWDDLDHADTPLDEVVRAARAAGSGWRGTPDALLTLEDTTRRPPLALGGVEGRETHLRGPALQSPLAVSVSQGETDLLVRLAWNRHHVAQAQAQGAFEALRACLARHLDPAPGRTPPATAPTR